MPLRPVIWNTADDESDLTEPPTSDEEDELENDEKTSPPHVPTPPSPPRPRSPPPKSLGRIKPTRPSTQQATQKSRARRDLSKESQPTLTETQFLTHAVYFLVELMKNGRIDVNPEYQRGVVWNDSKQGGFIDSLLHNYHTPSIVLAKGSNDDGMDVWRCIDGKQRLTSLYRFCMGEIPYKDSQSNKKYWFVNQPGHRRRLMPPVLKSKLSEKRIKIDEYTSITEEQERAVFQRVQLGVVLGPADRLPAINGANADLVRELRRRINTTEGFEGYLDWGRARGKDFQALARIVYFLAFGQTRKWDPVTARLEAFLHAKADGYTKLRELALLTIDIFCRISSHPSHSACFEKLSPLEFIMSNYLISREMRKLTDSQLSAAITRMRQDYASQKKDFKCGTANYKHMTTFIDKQLPKFILTLPKLPGEEVAALAPLNRRELSYDQFMDIADQPPQAESSKKRKRNSAAEDDGDMADSEEDDYVVTKAKPLQKKLKEPAPPSITSSPMRQTSSGKASLAKTTVKRAPQKRKSETSAPAPSTSSVAVKAPSSTTNQPLAKPSPLSCNVAAPGSGASAAAAARPQASGFSSRPSTQQNFQSGSSQPVPQVSGSTGRAASDRLGPLKRARAEIQTNSQQNSPQTLHLHINPSAPSWNAPPDGLQPRSASGQSDPVAPSAETAKASSSTNPLSLQIPRNTRQDSLGSPLTSVSASPSPMPGAYSPQFAQVHQALQSQPQQLQQGTSVARPYRALQNQNAQSAPTQSSPVNTPRPSHSNQQAHPYPFGQPYPPPPSRRPIPQRQAGAQQYFRASRDVDPNIARATLEINHGPAACNDLRGVHGPGPRQPPNSVGPSALELLPPRQFHQQQQ